MGCGNTKIKVLHQRQLTVTGVLKVTVVEATLERSTSSFFTMDPYIKLKLSNQSHKTDVKHNEGLQPKFNQTFIFYINSCYNKYGRCLDVEVWDMGKASDKEVGFAIVDVDPIINNRMTRTQHRAFINFERKFAGIVTLVSEFKEEQSETLSFRFEMVSIRRKTRALGDMNCHITVVIGEEVLSTCESKDTKEMPPTWIDDILTFNVPLCIKEIQIMVMDGFDVVGNVKIPIDDLLTNLQERYHAVDIVYQGMENAGTLKFQTCGGDFPQFTAVKTNPRKMELRSEKGELSAKKSQKSEEKESEKKDDKKKQQKQQKRSQKSEGKKNDKIEENPQVKKQNQDERKQQRKEQKIEGKKNDKIEQNNSMKKQNQDERKQERKEQNKLHQNQEIKVTRQDDF